jgi:Glycyl-tRNA synthetase, alpha subunit
MALQGVDHFKDIAYNDRMTYGEMRMQEEYEMSVFNLDEASVETHRERFNMADEEAIRMLEARLPLPAYDNLLKASHAFNVLDARGAVGVTERQKLFASMRKLARETAQLWVARREELGYPLGLAEAPAPAPPVERTGDVPSAPADCVIEIGTEELPPQDVTSTSRQFYDAVDALLKAEGLTHEGISVGATPRRFALTVKALSAGQPNVEERVRGPPLSRAFEEDGVTPGKAALGFCKKNGIDASELEKDGEYVWAVVKKEGRSTVAVLEEALPKIIAGIN